MKFIYRHKRESKTELKTKRKLLIEVVFLLVIISIALCMIPISAVNVSNNTAKYLHRASNILKGEDPGTLFEEYKITRGPVFPLILASALTFGCRMKNTVNSLRNI